MKSMRKEYDAAFKARVPKGLPDLFSNGRQRAGARQRDYRLSSISRPAIWR